MSFVKDDHKHTRGVGAIAAMDAVSSRRRRAQAQAGARMVRRDSIMARHTLGRINQEPTDGGGGGTPTTGGGGGGVRPPVRSPILDKIRIADVRNAKVLVKSPGSVITDPIRTPPPLPVYTPPVVVAPPKNTGIVPPTIVVGPPVATPPPRPVYVPPDMPTDELPDVTIDVEPPAAKSSTSFMLYAAIGVGALYLLTRNK